MKRLLIITTTLLLTSSLTKAQSIEDAKKELYYERYESAENMLQSITGKSDASPDAWYWLGETYLEENKPDSAKQAMQTGMDYAAAHDAEIKKNPLIYIGQAQILLNENNTAEARKQFDNILDETKHKNADALWAVAKANVESKYGDSAWAIDLLQQAAKRDKKNPEIYTTLGDAYRRMLDGSNAVISYDKALEVDPNYAEALYKKGKIYKTQNNPEIYVDRFEKAVAADSSYAPALYELYYYYYFRDVNKAADYLQAYIRHSDPSPEHAYMLADMNYVSKKWDVAVTEAQNILGKEGDSAKPRLYKMIAYSKAALGDSATALKNMDIYFNKQDDSALVAKDFYMEAKLLEKLDTNKAAPVTWLKKALDKEQDKQAAVDYMVSLADLENQLDNRAEEAAWREKIYHLKENATNLDLYKWGMAAYSAQDYQQADSVFGMYEEKYPDQIHGYLWRARSNALIDTTMKEGLAVPHYTKLVELISKDTTKNKELLVRAYEYLGAYEANTTKDYAASLNYYDKILQLDPENSEAKRNAEILGKWIEEGKGDSSK